MPKYALIAAALVFLVLVMLKKRNAGAARVAVGASQPIEPNMAGQAYPKSMAKPAKSTVKPSPGYTPPDAPASQEIVGIANADGSYTPLAPSFNDPPDQQWMEHGDDGWSGTTW